MNLKLDKPKPLSITSFLICLFKNNNFRNHYKDYSDLLFKTYGDRVKHWATFNEQEITAMFNFMHGMQNPSAEKCQVTKECKEAYLFIHNSILCHATVANIYNQKYKVWYIYYISLIILYFFQNYDALFSTINYDAKLSQ